MKEIRTQLFKIKQATGIRLWLDDERDPSLPVIQERFGALGDEIWVKTAQEAIMSLQNGNVSYISLDHDLGEGDSGYIVAKWIEEQAYYGKMSQLQWRVHSANPTGRDNIIRALQSAERFWNRE